MIIQKEIRNLIRDVAEEFDVPFEVAREIIYSQFKYVRQEAESGIKGDPATFKSIRLPFLGTFHFSKKKIDFLTSLQEEKNEEHNGELQSDE